MKKIISILIIENEGTWAEKISADLDQFGYKVTCHACTYHEALKTVTLNNYDIALLDIDLHNKTQAFELGRMIGHDLKKPFIFITGSSDPAMVKAAAAVNPSAYLPKPFSAASLFVSIQSAVDHQRARIQQQPKNLSGGHNFFFVKNGTRYKKIDWAEVTCLRSERNYTSVSTKTGEKYLIRSSLQKTLRDIIPAKLLSDFIQINRAEVLQIGYIDEIIGDEVKVEQQFYNITEGFSKALRQQLNIVL